MQGFSLGAGLAALAFWGFIAAVVVAGIWSDIRKKESQQETVRRLVESGQPIDKELMDRLISAGGRENSSPDRDFRITALWILPVSAGLAVLGLILGQISPEATVALLGVAALTACLGIGFFLASFVVQRWYPPDRGPTDI